MFLPNWLSFLPNAWNWSGLDYSMGAPFMPTCLVPWWVGATSTNYNRSKWQDQQFCQSLLHTVTNVTACYTLLQERVAVTLLQRNSGQQHYVSRRAACRYHDIKDTKCAKNNGRRHRQKIWLSTGKSSDKQTPPPLNCIKKCGLKEAKLSGRVLTKRECRNGGSWRSNIWLLGGQSTTWSACLFVFTTVIFATSKWEQKQSAFAIWCPM